MNRNTKIVLVIGTCVTVACILAQAIRFYTGYGLYAALHLGESVELKIMQNAVIEKLGTDSYIAKNTIGNIHIYHYTRQTRFLFQWATIYTDKNDLVVKWNANTIFKPIKKINSSDSSEIKSN